MNAPRYRDPQALRQALADRLRPLAKDSGVELAALQRQFAYDRLLCRVFRTDPQRWVLKGATAMLARMQGQARHTLDIDLYSRAGDLDEAEQALRRAAAIDLDDFFHFTLRPARPIAQGAGALRIPITAHLGTIDFARFHVDLVAKLAMTGTPDEVSPLVPIDLPGLPSTTYRAYPLVDHIADKVCGLLELHPRSGGRTESSTRYRDLADLVTLAHTAVVEATALRVALDSEARRRELSLPDRLEVPSGSDWPAGYARVARDAPGLRERGLEEALRSARRFIDPVLVGPAELRWNPTAMVWESQG